jgi:tRNA-dihydrouridine synthase B
MRAHLRNLYAHYGEWTGVRVARKHIAWYARGRPHAEFFRATAMQAESAESQLGTVDAFFAQLAHDARATAQTAA